MFQQNAVLCPLSQFRENEPLRMKPVFICLLTTSPSLTFATIQKEKLYLIHDSRIYMN